MKKVLVIFGVLLFAVVVTVGFLFVRWAAKKGRHLDQETRQYADASIVAVISNWNEQALLDRASVRLLDKIHEQNNLPQAFARWKNLGKLVKYEGSTGHPNMTVDRKHGIVLSALYLANAQFERGTATIRIVLIRERQGWRILSFELFGVPEAVAPKPSRPSHGMARPVAAG
jgi:hypothetical protein